MSMMLLVVAASMIGYLVTLRRLLGWPLPSIPLVLTAGAIDTLLLAGLTGNLRPVTLAVVVAGLALLLVSVARLRSDVSGVTRLPAGVVVFAGTCIFLAWRLRGATFGGWDEFSHWGLVSKEIIATNGLITTESNVLFKDYPPGSALFHYLATFGSGFSENRVYAAHGVLAFAGFAAVCATARWPLTIVTFLFGYLGLFVFARGVQTLDVDHIVAVFFGCGLGAYWVADDRGRVLRAIPVAFALPLIKSVGLLLAVFMTAAIVCDQLVRQQRTRRQLIILVLLAASPWIASRTWLTHVHALNLSPTFTLQASPGRVTDSFSTDRSTPRDRITLSAFRTALVSERVGPTALAGLVNFVLAKWGESASTPPGLSSLHWALVFLVVWSVVVAVQPDRFARARQVLALIWLLACAVCYGFGLLLLYLFSFGEYEGTHLASFGRYFGILFFGTALATLSFLLWQAGTQGRRGSAAAVALLLMTAGLAYVAPAEGARLLVEGPPPMSAVRAGVQNVAAAVLPKVDQSQRILVIWEGSNGFEFHMARYALAPRRTNTWCWSLGTPRFSGDIWTCNVPVEEFARTLREYDFVFLGYVDGKFWAEYGALFPKSVSALLYRIEAGATGLRLIPQ